MLRGQIKGFQYAVLNADMLCYSYSTADVSSYCLVHLPTGRGTGTVSALVGDCKGHWLIQKKITWV